MCTYYPGTRYRACACACTRACVYADMCARVGHMRVCVRMCVCACAHVCVYAFVPIPMCRCASMYMCKCEAMYAETLNMRGIRVGAHIRTWINHVNVKIEMEFAVQRID